MTIHLKTLLGDHAVSAALKRGDIASDTLTFDIAEVKVPNTAFKRVVRDLEFDVAELAIVTFLMAKDRGVPLTLLPAVLLARAQHPFLVHDVTRDRLDPRQLAGRRVGVRSWTVTTAVWLRQILADDYGVDARRVSWVTCEDAHVAGVVDPPGVERAPPGSDLVSMLRAGEIDAAIVGAPPSDARIRPLIADPAAAARVFQQRTGAIQINHVVVIRQQIAEHEPSIAREVVELFRASHEEARGAAASEAPGLPPFGIEANRRNLEVAIDATYRQGLIGRRFTVDELFGDGMRIGS